MNTVLKIAVAFSAGSITLSGAATSALAQMTMPEACKSKTASGDMAMPGGTDADPNIAFVCDMIAHHAAAIAMSELELKYGNDEETRSIAEKIIDTKKREIEEMTIWLKKHAK
ncbi:DUF305 domain-containing protein [Ensifer sp. P24N7]|uniref:DUF305 domain-containing protein n=1 Tax=Sinorhizobium sp. P24N7 TaxID=3348358 RepID=UPI0035F436AA